MTTINLSEAKDQLSQIVKDAAETTEPVVISVHGRKQAILLSVDEYDALKETIEILKDKSLSKKIGDSLDEIRQGKVVDFNQIKKDL